MDLRENSKIKRKPKEGFEHNNENISIGAILRIADSLEKMERPFLEQITHIKNLEQANEDLREKLKAKCDQFNGSRGYIKKLENENRKLKDEIGKEASHA